MFSRDKASNSVKVSKNKSVKFFRKKRNAANRSTVSGRIVTFSEVGSLIYWESSGVVNFIVENGWNDLNYFYHFILKNFWNDIITYFEDFRLLTLFLRYFSLLVWCYSECVSTPGGPKNMPGHGGIRTYDLWNTSPMLCQLSYAVRSVRVCDISELSLVPSISV